MVKYCPICGTELVDTTWGRKFCPNHGIIDEESKEYSNEDNNRSDKSYIG